MQSLIDSSVAGEWKVWDLSGPTSRLAANVLREIEAVLGKEGNGNVYVQLKEGAVIAPNPPEEGLLSTGPWVPFNIGHNLK